MKPNGLVVFNFDAKNILIYSAEKWQQNRSTELKTILSKEREARCFLLKICRKTLQLDSVRSENEFLTQCNDVFSQTSDKRLAKNNLCNLNHSNTPIFAMYVHNFSCNITRNINFPLVIKCIHNHGR